MTVSPMAKGGWLAALSCAPGRRCDGRPPPRACCPCCRGQRGRADGVLCCSGAVGEQVLVLVMHGAFIDILVKVGTTLQPPQIPTPR